MPLGRPRLGNRRRLHIELREDTYMRWKEAKQQLKIASDNALASYLLSRLPGDESQHLFTSQSEVTFNSGLPFSRFSTLNK